MELFWNSEKLLASPDILKLFHSDKMRKENSIYIIIQAPQQKVAMYKWVTAVMKYSIASVRMCVIKMNSAVSGLSTPNKKAFINAKNILKTFELSHEKQTLNITALQVVGQELQLEGLVMGKHYVEIEKVEIEIFV